MLSKNGRAVFEGVLVLTKGKCLRSTNFGSLLFDPSKSLLAIDLVRFVVHLDIVWRKTADLKIFIKRAVPTIKNVQLGKRQFRVLVSIESAVLVADVSSPMTGVSPDMSCLGTLNLRNRGPMGRVLAM